MPKCSRSGMMDATQKKLFKPIFFVATLCVVSVIFFAVYKSRGPSTVEAGIAFDGNSGDPAIDSFPTSDPSPHLPASRPTSVYHPTRNPTHVASTYAETRSPSLKPTVAPTLESSNSPTLDPSNSPTRSPSNPTGFPTRHPTDFPIEYPTNSPTRNPTRQPTPNPTHVPTFSPVRMTVEPTAERIIEVAIMAEETEEITFQPGKLAVSQNGLLLSQGLSSRIIGRSGRRVNYDIGGSSSVPFHALPDGAATYVDRRATNPGGWIYVSNSEVRTRNLGGVGAMTFDAQGRLVDYRMLLTGTTSNCAGGKTPWESWISCEETRGGRIWEVDPTGDREPRMITLGSPGNGDSGLYESFAYDIRDRDKAQFFVTEDFKDGPLRRWTVRNANWTDPWNILHGGGTVHYLLLEPSDSKNSTGRYRWTSDQSAGRENSALYFRNAEGLDVHENELFFISKRLRSIFVLDLDSNNYVRQDIDHDLFQGTPDQIVRILDGESSMLYFTEDTNKLPGAGVHARNSKGDFFTIVEGVNRYNETTGLAFNPDSTKMYVAWQNGTLFEIWRNDGLPFQAETLSVQYHA